MKTLLTAFGPFPGIPVNPSQLLLERLSSNPSLATALLETRYATAGPQVIEAIDRHRPDLFLMLGVRSKNPAIALERFALNIDDNATPDAAGIARQHQPIIPGAPAAYETDIDVVALRHALSPCPIPIEISNHAGTYLCNHAYYRALHHIHLSRLKTRALFIHIPLPSDDAVLNTLDHTLRNVIQQAQQICADV